MDINTMQVNFTTAYMQTREFTMECPSVTQESGFDCGCFIDQNAPAVWKAYQSPHQEPPLVQQESSPSEKGIGQKKEYLQQRCKEEIIQYIGITTQNSLECNTVKDHSTKLCIVEHIISRAQTMSSNLCVLLTTRSCQAYNEHIVNGK